MEPRISIITLGVQDLERSLRFYRDGLGLPTTRTADKGIIFFQTQGVCLALYPYDELEKDVGWGSSGERAKFPGVTLAHNVREREQVDEILKQAEAAGAKIEKYLVGEKFLNFLEAAEADADFRAEIPAFVAEIKTIFERWQLAENLERARQSEPFDPTLFEPRSHSVLSEEEIEFSAVDVEEMRKDDIRESARDLLLVERAREWLVEDEEAP